MSDAPADDAREGVLDFDALPPVERGSSLAAEWWIAWGHLRSKKSEAFLSAVTVMAIIGVTAGVALLNWVIGVMTGFEVDMRDKILGANAHIVVFQYGGTFDDYRDALAVIDSVEGVAAAAPFVYSEMMIRSDRAATGVILKGIDPSRTADVTHVAGDLTTGFTEDRGFVVTFEPGALAERRALVGSMAEPFPAVGYDNVAIPTGAQPVAPGLIIGDELREQLNVRVGDLVQLINPLGGSVGPMGMPTPSIREVRIAGVFDSGLYEYDTKWTYIDNGVAQSFLKSGDVVTGIEVRTHDADDVEAVAKRIDEALPFPRYSRHWKELNAKLFAALQLEKWVVGLLLDMIVVNAGLLIVTTLFMLVITKGREIAILKAIGATNGAINRIFIMEGCVIGGVGTVAGTVLGVAGCLFLDQYKYPLETDVYNVDTLPVVIDPSSVALIALSAFATCFVCTIYPAWRAATVDPVAALRYE